MKTFPEFEEEGHAKLIRLDEDAMKSKDGKEKWRTFINSCVLLSLYRIELPSIGVPASLALDGFTHGTLGIRLDDQVREESEGPQLWLAHPDEL